MLRGRVGRYLYISTVAVYDFDSGSVFDESSPLARLEDPSVEEVNWSTYGPLKAECDRIVRGVYGDSSTVVRPIYIVGPGDIFAILVRGFESTADPVPELLELEPDDVHMHEVLRGAHDPVSSP